LQPSALATDELPPSAAPPDELEPPELLELEPEPLLEPEPELLDAPPELLELEPELLLELVDPPPTPLDAEPDELLELAPELLLELVDPPPAPLDAEPDELLELAPELLDGPPELAELPPDELLDPSPELLAPTPELLEAIPELVVPDELVEPELEPGPDPPSKFVAKPVGPPLPQPHTREATKNGRALRMERASMRPLRMGRRVDRLRKSGPASHSTRSSRFRFKRPDVSEALHQGWTILGRQRDRGFGP
jgi:hypothetical protein